MITENEVNEARKVVPFARASFLIREVEDQATDLQLKELLELMAWAYEFDQSFDWAWHLKDCPLLKEVSSYREAAELVEGWFGNNLFPLNQKWQDELNIFECWVLPVLDDWIEDRLDHYTRDSTWKGEKGRHAVHWDRDRLGYVVVYDSDNPDPSFDRQL